MNAYFAWPPCSCRAEWSACRCIRHLLLLEHAVLAPALDAVDVERAAAVLAVPDGVALPDGADADQARVEAALHGRADGLARPLPVGAVERVRLKHLLEDLVHALVLGVERPLVVVAGRLVGGLRGLYRLLLLQILLQVCLKLEIFFSRENGKSRWNTVTDENRFADCNSISTAS